MPLILQVFYTQYDYKILPFIIFISSMWFMMKIRNNKDLLTLKVFGYSNFKIFFILASTFYSWLDNSCNNKSDHIINVQVL